MYKFYADKKSISCIASIAMLVYAAISFIAACLCTIGKKKTTASIFIALAGISAALGGVTAYTLGLFERSGKKDIDDYFEDYDDDDGFDIDEDGNEEKENKVPYIIPVDDTANEDEFNI